MVCVVKNCVNIIDFSFQIPLTCFNSWHLKRKTTLEEPQKQRVFLFFNLVTVILHLYAQNIAMKSNLTVTSLQEEMVQLLTKVKSWIRLNLANPRG